RSDSSPSSAARSSRMSAFFSVSESPSTSTRRRFPRSRVNSRTCMGRHATRSDGADSAEEEPRDAVPALVAEAIAELGDEAPERGELRGRDLEPGEHAAVVGSVVPVVEEADVPAPAHPVEEAHQRAGALGELESVEALVPRRGRASADEVTEM